MSETANVYDVIVIGAGPIGQNVADRARAAGLTVAVVEREEASAPTGRAFPARRYYGQ
jgi:pyruvate/2-oxoglutarate dehydrogenase complex dihydrolipoamide dehydrogenase (E3) component